MTQTSKNLILGLTALILGLALGAGVARLASAVTVDPAASAAERQAVTLEAGDTTTELTARGATTRATAEQLGTDYGIVRVALGDNTDYTPEQVTAVLAAADRVCEGQTAGVPITTLEQTVAAASGLDLPTAHDFVALVLLVHC